MGLAHLGKTITDRTDHDPRLESFAEPASVAADDLDRFGGSAMLCGTRFTYRDTARLHGVASEIRVPHKPTSVSVTTEHDCDISRHNTARKRVNMLGSVSGDFGSGSACGEFVVFARCAVRRFDIPCKRTQGSISEPCFSVSAV